MDSRLEPVRVQSADDAEWAETADVVVVGCGAAGIAAALQAAERGASVIVIDRFGGGGASWFSGGVVYAGGGTSIQKEAGVEDSVDEMTRYLAMEVGDVVSPAVVRTYCERSAATLDWLQRLGVPYGSAFWKEKAIYPPDGFYLHYSGNEKVPDYAAQAKPAPRGHRAIGTGPSGYAMMNALLATAAEKGVRLIKHATVDRLVCDATGRVVGVGARVLPDRLHDAHQKLMLQGNPQKPFTAKRAAKAGQAAEQMEAAEGEPRLVRASRGVILATGGYSYNLDLLKQHDPRIAANVESIMRMATLADRGDGLVLGQSVGGSARDLDSLYIGRGMAPPQAFLRGVLVNRTGKRFVNEAAYNSVVGRAIADQAKSEAWLILPGSLLRTAVRESFTGGRQIFEMFGAPALLNILFGGTRRGRTLEALARKLGVDGAALVETVAGYNRAVGSKDEFGKQPDLKTRLEGGSWYALNFSLSNRFSFMQVFSLGGLRVSEEGGQVLDGNDRPVPGLYAAGRAAHGLCSRNYISGLSLGDCVFTGRRAADHCLVP